MFSATGTGIYTRSPTQRTSINGRHHGSSSTPSKTPEIGAHRLRLHDTPRSPPNWFQPTTTIPAFSLNNLIGGDVQVVSYPDTSQYSQGGASACGLAAMNCVRMVLNSDHEGIREEELLRLITQKDFVDEVMSICSLWTSTLHLEIDDIFDTPFFKAFLRLERQEFGRPEQDKFEEMLLNLGNHSTNPYTRRCRAVVITRPPEIVVCLRIPIRFNSVYAIFDSHPRPKHPNGAAFTFFPTASRAAAYLTSLLQVDASLLDEGAGLQWQAQLLGNVAGHFFTHSGANVHMSVPVMTTFIESNLNLLRTKAEATEIKARCNELKRENEALLKEMRVAEAEKRAAAESKRKAQLEEERRRDHERNATKGSNVPLRFLIGDAGVSSKPKRQPNGAHVGGSATQSPRVAAKRPTELHNMSPSTSAPVLVKVALPEKPRYSDEEVERSLRLAAQMQEAFTREDAQLRREADHLRATTARQVTFECVLCMDEHPDDCLAEIEKCGHNFCRDGLRQYIRSKIESSRYPIMCPVCSAKETMEASEAGVISRELIMQIGISEVEYATYEEMELSMHSVMTHCRQCGNTSYVQKDDFEEAKVLFCPLPGCRYMWCKACQVPIPLVKNPEEPEHSCDGSSELTHLMKQRGWKHCPGCKTPTEKIDGCNHMTCMSTGCNTHFCYVCGDLIYQGALRSGVKEAIETHYRTCQLFEEIPDHDTPPSPLTSNS